MVLGWVGMVPTPNLRSLAPESRVNVGVLFSCSVVPDSFATPMGYSPPGSSVHGISQARILEWVAISSSRGSSQDKDQTCVSCTAGGFFTTEPPGKPACGITHHPIPSNFTSQAIERSEGLGSNLYFIVYLSVFSSKSLLPPMTQFSLP